MKHLKTLIEENPTLTAGEILEIHSSQNVSDFELLEIPKYRYVQRENPNHFFLYKILGRFKNNPGRVKYEVITSSDEGIDVRTRIDIHINDGRYLYLKPEVYEQKLTKILTLVTLLSNIHFSERLHVNYPFPLKTLEEWMDYNEDVLGSKIIQEYEEYKHLIKTHNESILKHNLSLLHVGMVIKSNSIIGEITKIEEDIISLKNCFEYWGERGCNYSPTYDLQVLPEQSSFIRQAYIDLNKLKEEYDNIRRFESR